MPGILIDCLRKYQRLSQTPLESTRAPVHFLMLGGAGQAVPTIDAYGLEQDLCSTNDFLRGSDARITENGPHVKGKMNGGNAAALDMRPVSCL